MALDRIDRIQARKDMADLLRERSEALIAESLALRQYSRELVQASRKSRFSLLQD